MYMNSNEPFQRVNEGTSPLVTGLAGAIGVGGAAAAFQGLNHASYTGIDSKYDRQQSKINASKENIANMSPEITGTSKNPILKFQSSRVDKKINNLTGSIADINDQIKHHEKTIDVGPSESNHRMSRREVQQGKPISQLQKYSTAVAEKAELLRQNQSHSQMLNSANQRKEHLDSKINYTKENKKYTKLQNSISAGEERYSEANRVAEKEAHSYHGKSFKTSAKTAGLFAAGGFVAGGAVQMLGNKISNA